MLVVRGLVSSGKTVLSSGFSEKKFGGSLHLTLGPYQGDPLERCGVARCCQEDLLGFVLLQDSESVVWWNHNARVRSRNAFDGLELSNESAELTRVFEFGEDDDVVFACHGVGSQDALDSRGSSGHFPQFSGFGIDEDVGLFHQEPLRILNIYVYIQAFCLLC